MREALSIGLISFGLFTLVACNPRDGEPATQLVQGKIAFKGGKVYAEGGQVEFLHAEKVGVSARGEIQKDGSFALHTMTAQNKVNGAVEGTYAIKIIVSGANQSVKVYDLKKKYTIGKGVNNLMLMIDDEK